MKTLVLHSLRGPFPRLSRGGQASSRRPVHTCSIVARDPITGDRGVAVHRARILGASTSP